MKVFISYIIGAIALVGILAGCQGCGESALDAVERRFREEPSRGGKVGTLRGLEAAQQARQAALEMARGADGPCQIQWRWDRPFEVEYELAIQANRGRWERRWKEKGRFFGDGKGDWLLEGSAEFLEGDQLQGKREVQGYREGEHFWERLGSEQVGQHRGDGETARSWEREYGGRFGSLMALISSEWEPRGEGRWVPGTGEFYCGPLEIRDVEGWRPLLGARAELRDAEVVREQGCRRLRGAYGLKGGGSLEVVFSECFQPGEDNLGGPELGEDNVVVVRRHRERRELGRLIEELIETGTVQVEDDEG